MACFRRVRRSSQDALRGPGQVAPGLHPHQHPGPQRQRHGRVGRLPGGEVTVDAGRTEADQKPVPGTDVGGDGTAVLQQHEHRAPPRPPGPLRGRSVTFGQAMHAVGWRDDAATARRPGGASRFGAAEVRYRRWLEGHADRAAGHGVAGSPARGIPGAPDAGDPWPCTTTI